MKFLEIVKKIFIGIWNVIKAFSKLLQDLMQSQYERWDKEFEAEERQKEVSKKAKEMTKIKPVKTTTRQQQYYEINPDEFDEIHLKRRKKDDK
jgi:hypothetical protein